MGALNGMDIKLHAAGSGPPLVLLHCLGVDYRFWDFAAPLAGNYCLMRYDLPGHGETPIPRVPYQISDLSAQLLGILKSRGIKRVSIAGISLGGLIAQHFAAHYPDRSKSLCSSTQRRVTPTNCARCGSNAPQPREPQGVASMVPGLLKIWFSDACLASNPPGVRYVRETLQKTSGEGYALACEALGAADLAR